MKHTPGEWRQDDHGAILVHFNQDHPDGGFWSPICHIEMQNNGKANMPLIAAAPDMYEALGALLDEQNGVPLLSREKQYTEAVDKATAALAKAEGRRA